MILVGEVTLAVSRDARAKVCPWCSEKGEKVILEKAVVDDRFWRVSLDSMFQWCTSVRSAITTVNRIHPMSTMSLRTR